MFKFLNYYIRKTKKRTIKNTFASYSFGKNSSSKEHASVDRKLYYSSNGCDITESYSLYPGELQHFYLIKNFMSKEFCVASAKSQISNINSKTKYLERFALMRKKQFKLINCIQNYESKTQ